MGTFTQSLENHAKWKRFKKSRQVSHCKPCLRGQAWQGGEVLFPIFLFPSPREHRAGFQARGFFDMPLYMLLNCIHAALICLCICCSDMPLYMLLWYASVHAALICLCTCSFDMPLHMLLWYASVHAALICFCTCFWTVYLLLLPQTAPNWCCWPSIIRAAIQWTALTHAHTHNYTRTHAHMHTHVHTHTQ